MARGLGRPAWNHKALVSPEVGRGRDAPPPPAETFRVLVAKVKPSQYFRRVPPYPPGLTKAVASFFKTQN